MGKVMVIDITKCNGCYNCQISCKDEHVGNDWTPMLNHNLTPDSSGLRLRSMCGDKCPR